LFCPHPVLHRGGGVQIVQILTGKPNG